AYIKGVAPPGPLRLEAVGFSRSSVRKRLRSPLRRASIIRAALGSTAVGGGSPDRASGHSAPWSIHALIVRTWSSFNGPVGGIGNPYWPINLRYSLLPALFPGPITTIVPPFMASRRRSSRKPPICWLGPWQPTQYCLNNG